MSWHAIPVCPGLDCELAIRFNGTTWVDVTDYLRSFSTDISRSRSLGVFPPGDATFTLDNRDGRFTPLNGSSPYTGNIYPGRHIRYRERYATVEYDVWYGIIEDWGDSYPQARDGIATVSAYQPSTLLANYKTAELTATVGAGEGAGDRIDRLLTASSWPMASTLDDGYVPLQGTIYADDVLSEITKAVEAEMGALWCQPNGSLKFENRYALLINTRSNTSQATFGPANVPYVGEPPLSSGLDLVINQMTCSIVGGTEETYTNSTSVTTLGGVYSDRQTGLISTGAEWAMGNAYGHTLLYGLPVQHPTSIDLMLARSPSTVIPQALGRAMRDKVTVNVPTPWGTTLSCLCWIVGINHTGSAQEGRRTRFEFEPATNFHGLSLFVLDSSSLDGTHILGW